MLQPTPATPPLPEPNDGANALRQAASAKAVADLLGCHGRTARRYRAGTSRPGPERRARLLEAYRIPLDSWDRTETQADHDRKVRAAHASLLHRVLDTVQGEPDRDCYHEIARSKVVLKLCEDLAELERAALPPRESIWAVAARLARARLDVVRPELTERDPLSP